MCVIKSKLFKVALSLVAIAALFSACHDTAPQGQAIIRGTLRNAHGGYLVLKTLDIRNVIALDSVKVHADGAFVMPLLPTDEGLYVLSYGKDNYCPLVLKPGQTLEFSAEALALQATCKVARDSVNVLLCNYTRHTANNRRQVDSLEQIYRIYSGSDGFFAIKSLLDQSFSEILADQKQVAAQLIDANPSTLAALFVLNQRFSNRLLFPEKVEMERFMRVDSALMRRIPKNSHALDHHQRVSNLLRGNMEQQLARERLSQGREAPDFTLPTLSGASFQLSEYRGAPLLIHFWASAYAPSRKANLELRKIYHRYHPKGFQVCAISVDHNEELWKSAVKVDTMQWINILAQESFKSAVTNLYNVKQLPGNYLLDAKGNIVAHNITMQQLPMLLDSLYHE